MFVNSISRTKDAQTLGVRNPSTLWMLKLQNQLFRNFLSNYVWAFIFHLTDCLSLELSPELLTSFQIRELVCHTVSLFGEHIGEFGKNSVQQTVWDQKNTGLRVIKLDLVYWSYYLIGPEMVFRVLLKHRVLHSAGFCMFLCVAMFSPHQECKSDCHDGLSRTLTCSFKDNQYNAIINFISGSFSNELITSWKRWPWNE